MKEINIEKYRPQEFEGIEKEYHPYYMTASAIPQTIGDSVAFHIWSYLQSLPTDWDIRKEQIKSHIGIGENIYEKSMSLLKKCNLIDYVRRRDPKGNFVRTRILAKSGKDYVNPSDFEKSYPQRSTPMKSIGVDTHNEKSITYIHSHENPGSGEPCPWVSTPLTNNIDIQNKKTTTTDQVEKNNHPIKGDIALVQSSSKFVFDLSCLRKFGFAEGHVEQLLEMKIPQLAIQESMNNFAKQLENEFFASKIKNKVSYFMGTMRKCKYYSLPLTQKESDAKYDAAIERQEEIRRSKELAAQAHYQVYDISLDEVAERLNEVPKSIQDVLRRHVRVSESGMLNGNSACV